jgi:hypothetical protein
MEARTIRVYWRNVQVGWLNFNWDGVIFPKSVVHVSVCEAQIEQGRILGNWQDHASRYRGDAVVGVKNVRPHGPNAGDHITGGVEFYVEITNHRGPINVVTDITVMGEPGDAALV